MGRGPNYTEGFIAMVHARYVAGESTAKLAKEFGVSQNGLNGAFRKRGLWQRPPGQAWLPYCTEAMARAAHRRYVRGESAEDMADELGMTYAGLLFAFHRYKLLVRRPGRPVGARGFKTRREHECVDVGGLCLGCNKPMSAAATA